MKSYKLGLFAIMIAIAASAFTNATDKNLVDRKTQTHQWFVYDDTGDDVADQSEAMQQSNYRPATSVDLEGCVDDVNLCAIYAEDENGLPKISGQPIAGTIEDYFDNRPVSETELLLKP